MQGMGSPVKAVVLAGVGMAVVGVEHNTVAACEEFGAGLANSVAVRSLPDVHQLAFGHYAGGVPAGGAPYQDAFHPVHIRCP